MFHDLGGDHQTTAFFSRGRRETKDETEAFRPVENGSIEILLYLKSHAAILEVVAKSRAVLVPSYYPTTGEFYLIEALGLGKPVVVFDAGIHAEIIESGVNGMISPVGDQNAFFENVKRVNDDYELRKKLSRGAKELFTELVSFQRLKSSMRQYFASSFR